MASIQFTVLIFPGVCISSYLGKRYMCLKLSIAMSGKSSFDFPRWWSGCANFSPSAIKKFTFSESNIEIIVVLNQWWEEVAPSINVMWGIKYTYVCLLIDTFVPLLYTLWQIHCHLVYETGWEMGGLLL